MRFGDNPEKCLMLPVQNRARTQSLVCLSPELIPFAMCQTVSPKDLWQNTGTASPFVFRHGCTLEPWRVLLKNSNVWVPPYWASGLIGLQWGPGVGKFFFNGWANFILKTLHAGDCTNPKCIVWWSSTRWIHAGNQHSFEETQCCQQPAVPLASPFPSPTGKSALTSKTIGLFFLFWFFLWVASYIMSLFV